MQYGLCALVILAGAATAQADDRAAALAIIEKAIKAQGGEELLNKAKTISLTGKGVVHGMGLMIPFTFEGSFGLPDKARSDVEVDVQGMKFKVINAVNGNKGWISQMGNVMDMDDGALNEAKEQSHARLVELLVPLRDKAFELSLLGDSKVDGKDAVGVRVSHKGRRDVSLFFDKNSFLTLKTETRALNPFTMQEANQETFYTDFKEINGVKEATKMKVHMDKELFMEMEDMVVKILDKLDDSLFQKP